MQRRQTSYTAAVLAVIISGCAATPEEESVLLKNDAVDDYIVVAELESIDEIRTTDTLHHRIITENYIILSNRNNAYLLAFERRCRELSEQKVTPDDRHSKNTLSARFDRYRGCWIRSLYGLTPGQAKELISLGESLDD